jgi:hypothetical protein
MLRISFVKCVILHRQEEHFAGGLGVVMFLENLCFQLSQLLKPSMKGQHTYHQPGNKTVYLLQYRSWQATVSLSIYMLSMHAHNTSLLLIFVRRIQCLKQSTVCVILAFRTRPHRMLRVFQHFSKPCVCHLHG